jgi:5-methylcytosine-specific restriction endonuclease McrA
MLDSPAFQALLARLATLPSHDPTDDLVRMVVQARARDACEYCLMPALTQFHVDHIIPRRRWRAYLQGALLTKPSPLDAELDHLDNFAWCCPYCNTSKGDRVSGRVGQRTYPLFHPRRDQWNDHFMLTSGHFLIRGVTDIGRATVHTLAFNSSRQNGPLVVRHHALMRGIFPPEWARSWGS